MRERITPLISDWLIVAAVVLLGLGGQDMLDQYARIEVATESHRAAAERALRAVEHDHPARIAATRGSDLVPALPRGTP